MSAQALGGGPCPHWWLGGRLAGSGSSASWGPGQLHAARVRAETSWLEPASSQQEVKPEHLEVRVNIKKLNTNISMKNSEANPHAPQGCLITHQVIGQWCNLRQRPPPPAPG